MYSQLVVASQLEVGTMLFDAIIFLILMWLIKVFAWKPITKIMKDRADKIANDIDSAEQSRDEAAKLEQQRSKALANSQAEAEKIVTNAESTGQKQRDKIVSDAQNDAQQLKDRAHEDIKDERAEALAGAKDDVANLSIEIASKIISKNLDAKDQEGLIDSYIEGLGKDDTK